LKEGGTREYQYDELAGREIEAGADSVRFSGNAVHAGTGRSLATGRSLVEAGLEIAEAAGTFI